MDIEAMKPPEMANDTRRLNMDAAWRPAGRSPVVPNIPRDLPAMRYRLDVALEKRDRSLAGREPSLVRWQSCDARDVQRIASDASGARRSRERKNFTRRGDRAGE